MTGSTVEAPQTVHRGERGPEGDEGALWAFSEGLPCSVSTDLVLKTIQQSNTCQDQTNRRPQVIPRRCHSSLGTAEQRERLYIFESPYLSGTLSEVFMDKK